MSTVIAKAEKKAANPLIASAQEPPAANIAVSIRASWDAVSKLVSITVPLRRPKRTRPSSNVENPLPPFGGFATEEEQIDWDSLSDSAWNKLDSAE